MGEKYTSTLSRMLYVTFKVLYKCEYTVGSSSQSSLLNIFLHCPSDDSKPADYTYKIKKIDVNSESSIPGCHVSRFNLPSGFFSITRLTCGTTKLKASWVKRANTTTAVF